MKRTQKISRKFIGFLVASIFIWLLITLSKEYITSITFPVLYANLPQDKLLQSVPKTAINLVVKATGFNIIRAKFKNKPISLEANSLSKKARGNYYFLTKNQLNNIQKQLLSRMDLQGIAEDTIYLELGVLTSKKIPIKLDSDISYHVGFDISKEIELQPDSLVISGPESQVQNINHINLSPLKLEDVKSNFSQKVNIIKTENSKNINYSAIAVLVNGTVEKFTEGTFSVPFEIVNLPKNLQLTTLSKTAELVYVVSLSNFNKVDINSFKIECDYRLSEKNNLDYLLPKLVAKPSFIKSYKMIPNKIDFLIQK